MKHVKALTAGVDLDNATSRRVLQKLGAREGEIVKNGMKRFVRAPVESDCMWTYLDRPVGAENGN
jgi:RimJ/RimL family protein N-acetyltransferase